MIGTKSSEQYKIYNNEQITTPQMSGLGTDVQNVPVAAIGQADDTGLVSNDILQLQHLLQLTLNYCAKYQVELSTTKTKLLAFNTSETEYSKYVKLLSTIHIGETNIPFTDSAEHVGIISVCVWQPPSHTPEAGEPQKSTKRHFVHWNVTPSPSQPSS